MGSPRFGAAASHLAYGREVERATSDWLQRSVRLLAGALAFVLRKALKRPDTPTHTIEVTRPQAPLLFETIDRMRARLGGPAIHRVFVSGEMNAAARRQTGPTGLARNQLILGLALLDSLPVEEAMAVLAHEYGHLLHAGEVEADGVSADLTSPQVAAAALRRTHVAAMQHADFLDTVFANARHAPAPPGDLLERWAEIAATPSALTDRQRWLHEADARARRDEAGHPALAKRLAALGAAAESSVPAALSGPSAAEGWLGTQAAPLRRALQAAWQAEAAAGWSLRHAAWQRQQQRLHSLCARPRPTLDERAEALALKAQLAPGIDHLPAFQAFNAAAPGHALGLYLEGEWRLRHGDASGLLAIDSAIAADAATAKDACACAARFLERCGDARAGAYHNRWLECHARDSRRSLQWQTIGPLDELRHPELSAEEFAAVSRLLHIHRHGIARAWIARRVLADEPALRGFVLGLQLAPRRQAARPDVMGTLAACEWPVPLLICTLEGRLKPLKRRFEALGSAAILRR